MATVSVRISASSHLALKQMAEAQHKPVGEVLNQAVESYRREQLWQKAESAYAKLRADPDAWADWEREIDLFDSTAADGLDSYPYGAEAMRQETDAGPG